MGSAEETNFVQDFSTADVEERESLVIGIRMNERITDLSGNNDTILFDAGNAGGFFDGRRGKTFTDEGSNERGVFVPDTETVSEDFETSWNVEVTVFWRERSWGWSEGLIELSLWLLLLLLLLLSLLLFLSGT